MLWILHAKRPVVVEKKKRGKDGPILLMLLTRSGALIFSSPRFRIRDPRGESYRCSQGTHSRFYSFRPLYTGLVRRFSKTGLQPWTGRPRRWSATGTILSVDHLFVRLTPSLGPPVPFPVPSVSGLTEVWVRFGPPFPAAPKNLQIGFRSPSGAFDGFHSQ